MIYTDKTVPKVSNVLNFERIAESFKLTLTYCKVKETINSSLSKYLDESSHLALCDLSQIEDLKEKCETYDALVQASEQAVLTADLDYLVMEAVVKRQVPTSLFGFIIYVH